MGRRFVIAAFIVAALLPQALAAQTASSSKTTTHTNNNHANSGKNTKHHRHESPWSRNVIVTGINAQDYLYPSYATAAPKTPKKNTVNKPGGTVFKSIGN